MDTSNLIRFAPDVEHVAPDEAETQADLMSTMRGIMATTSKNYGHAVRGVHAKSHAILEGEITVGTLPPELAQGAFAVPGTYPVVLRISTNPGDILNDAVSVPRGLGLKIIGVEGARLPGSEGDATQDFVMANAPAFSAPDAKTFLKSLKLLAGTTDRGEGAKMVLSTAMRGLNTVLHSVGVESPTVTSMGGQKLTNPVGETFYSQTPLRWGDYVGKVSVAPVSPNLVALIDAPVALKGNPNALRQAAIDAMRDHGGEWEVRVQLCTDLATMPIEDATVEWPQPESPYRTVGRIRVAAQPAWSEDRAERVDDRLSFSPWHGLAAHQPLGSINRARKPVYVSSAEDRAARNGDTITEPEEALHLSDAPANAVGTTPGREGFRNARRARRASTRGTRAIAGAVGGLAGGLLVSALLLAKQAWSGDESDFARMRRQAGGKLGTQPAGGAVTSYAVHMGLAAATGAAYGALAPADAGTGAGLTFGLGLGVAHGVGQAAMADDSLRTRVVQASPWRDTGPHTVQHLLLNTLFGLTTALVTRAVARRLADES